MLGTAIASVAASATATAALTSALITTDTAVLRASPHDGAQQQATLRQGELVEVRGERLDYLQVYDYQRERGGFVKASQVRRTALAAGEAPELLAVLRFVRDQPGQEALGIALAAAWLKAAPAEMVQGAPGVETLDALGTLADRLAARASSGGLPNKAAEAALTAQLEVAGRYGVRFLSYEHASRMQVCYEGEAFRRVLAMAATPEQQARAALALTRPECAAPTLRAQERLALDQWRSGVLARVDTTALPGFLKNRVLMRRASLWAGLAYQYQRFGLAGDPAQLALAGNAATQALAELGSVNRNELTDTDQGAYNNAAMRVGASRWAAVPGRPIDTQRPHVATETSASGETCVLLLDARHDARNPLARRCTYSIVWAPSATLNREGNALALAVQPLEGWRELWLFRLQGREWTVSVLPPATTAPEIGYAEFAGWVPGGQQMLVAREARGEGKYRRSYELVSLNSLRVERQSGDAASLGVFQRWQDAGWKRMTVSLR